MGCAGEAQWRMSDRKVVPIRVLTDAVPMPFDVQAPSPGSAVRDRRARPLTDLRISVTDRCNFRCAYCMPKQVFGPDHRFLPHAELLSFEEIARLARIFVGLGVRKVRLTGGEPLLRRDLDVLIAQLAALRTPDGAPLDLTLTTNGSALAAKAAALKAAGLQRVTVSLDGLDDTVFRRMNDVDFPVQRVLDGIAAAHAAGLGPVKVNMVVQRGVNDHEVLPMARHFRGTGVVLRFIEYMDVGDSNGWCMDQVVPSAELRRRLSEHFALRPLDPTATSETAERWAYEDGQGEVGFISSVTQAFCSDCSRARLSTDGRLYACLFASEGHDVRRWLRSEVALDDARIAAGIAAWWQTRDAAYSEQRLLLPPDRGSGKPRVEMSFIGG
jgi:cyclic pyranopterin phosphate synthase